MIGDISYFDMIECCDDLNHDPSDQAEFVPVKIDPPAEDEEESIIDGGD
jgi:hypothetical protein